MNKKYVSFYKFLTMLLDFFLTKIYTLKCVFSNYTTDKSNTFKSG